MSRKKRKKRTQKPRKKAKKIIRKQRKLRQPKVIQEVRGIPAEPVDETQTLTKKAKFQQDVLLLAKQGITILEAIEEYCEKHGIEYESVGKLLTPHLQELIYKEAREFNLIKKENTVDL